MRSEKQIKERIEIYKAQTEQWVEDIENNEEYSARQLYRAWIRKNMEFIELLIWVLGE